MTQLLSLLRVVLSVVVFSVSWFQPYPPSVATAEEIDFNRDIRPILSENCFYCHGQDENKREAGLRLDDRMAAIDAGAIDPENPSVSLLLDRIDSEDPDVLMPPPDSNRRLSASQKDLLKRWLLDGAEYQMHWAFVRPTRSTEPQVSQNDWPKNPIDRFVLDKLELNGLEPSPEADRQTLIKRLYIDLIGLPPTPDQVQAFCDDLDPLAYERLVDKLLNSRHYGERMALPWLDAARYADSNGFQQDGDTWQWVWRDWVVRAFNDDMPFDQFTIEQLAGDLLPRATDDQKIASAFNRNHLLNGEGGAIAEEQRFNILFDRIDTTATTWLGLTMACAQCHDHKYDPITQRDYYQLVDAFNRVPETGTPQYFSSRIRVGNPVLELPTEENKARIADFEARIAELNQTLSPLLDAAFAGWRQAISPENTMGLPDALVEKIKRPSEELTDQIRIELQSEIEAELRSHFEQQIRPKLKPAIAPLQSLESLQAELAAYRADQIPRVMIMSDDQPRETAILNRGEYLKPTEKVTFDVPGFLPPMAADAPLNRLGFAQWLVSPENPLTARVQVNRMWQYFFGVGIVKTVEDFGVQSEYPIHGPLLDWLAVEFQSQGWSMKSMHRLIVTSATYRQSSRISEKQLELDRENRLFSRASRFRMPAMLLRDWALATAGLLQPQIGGAPVYPYQPSDVWESLSITKERDFTYPASTGEDLYRRSLYTFWRRTVNPANMFDAANRQTCQVRASLTSTPLHALTTLNDPTWVEAARVLAAKVMVSNSTPESQIANAMRCVLCREPSDDNLQRLLTEYNFQLEMFNADPTATQELLSTGTVVSPAPKPDHADAAHHAAMTVICLGIYNLDQALTRE